MVHEIENFFGVYLLYSVNPKFKGRVYIGFTVDPNRRIKQHNTGSHAGGAHKTSGRGPWDMVMIVHGFPNQISALRFEWAWQNPDTSKRLRHITKKTRKEKVYDYKFRVVCEMLRTRPWSRLPLTFRWLKQEYVLEFESHLRPPIHMPIEFGPVIPTKPKKDKEEKTEGSPTSSNCDICNKLLQVEDKVVRCFIPSCSLKAHIMCLADRFLQEDGSHRTELIPIQGTCPGCSCTVLWGDLIRFIHGCYQGLQSQHQEVSHWADEDFEDQI